MRENWLLKVLSFSDKDLYCILNGNDSKYTLGYSTNGRERKGDLFICFNVISGSKFREKSENKKGNKNEVPKLFPFDCTSSMTF